ncbi:hypothetical protein V6N13_085399 [Hibiscus sabdariffa]
MGPSTNSDNWIGFQYVDKMLIKGGGTLDGQGPSAWSSNDCQTNTNCKQLPTTASHVQIKDVTYRNIWGTSSSPLAISMECSSQFPCQNIVMTDIVLAHFGPRGPSKSMCSYVSGRHFGRHHPSPCF